MRTHILIIILVAALYIQEGCRDKKPGAEISPGLNTVSEIATVYKPFSFAFLDDHSGSRVLMGIPPLSVPQLDPAINYVSNYGGSVMLGIIAANSDFTTVQFSIDPSLAPVKPHKPEISGFTNRFSYYNAEKDYNENKLQSYRKDSANYRKMVCQKADKFRKDAAALLSAKHDDGSTDIPNAINRSLFFHQTAPAGSKHYTVLISDGISNVKGKVNASGNISVEYFCAYASTKAQGDWIASCRPIFAPDLTTALEKIGIH